MVETIDTQLLVFIENVEFFIGKLRRYCEGASEDEMEWTPTEIRNSLAWIIRYCAGLATVGFRGIVFPQTCENPVLLRAPSRVLHTMRQQKRREAARMSVWNT